VHDCFNWLTVIALLTLEVTTGYLFNLTDWLTGDLESVAGQANAASSAAGVNVLGAITKPVT